MISIQRGGRCRETFENPADPHHPYLYNPAQANRVALETVFASFACLCVWGCEGVKGWLPQLDFNFRVSFRICNGQNETIHIKFWTQKQLMNWHETSNRRRLRNFILYMNITQNCTWTSRKTVHEHHTKMYMNITQNCTWTSHKTVHEHHTKLHMNITQNCTWTSHKAVHEHHTKLHVNITQNCTWTSHKIVHEHHTKLYIRALFFMDMKICHSFKWTATRWRSLRFARQDISKDKHELTF